MSYIANPHRPYDSPDPTAYSHSQLSPQNTRNILSVVSFDSLSAHHSAQSPDHRLPKVGDTRCYWTLLSADLHFVYLDPVLSYHLVDQADLLIGQSLLKFVHPDEQASAKNDLGNVLKSKALHGSVTRMRYSRLSRVRRLLGHQGPPHFWPDGDKIAVDSNYMAVDLVINWAADDLVLCFIHAAVDLTPYDNDEHAKTGWTNWCGTNSMTQEQAQILYSRLLNNLPRSGNMSRVFQIMMNQPDRALLLSWPPDRDEAPSARDFAKLCGDVQIRSEAVIANDAKTTCTRRYKATSSIQTSDGFRDVESVCIPHGCIIFACHSVSSDTRSASENTALQQAEYDASSPYMTQGPQYYPQTTSYSLPSMQHSPTTYSTYLSQSVPQNTHPTASQVTSQYSSQQGWSSVIDPSPPSLSYNHWSSTAPQTGSPAYHSNSQQPRQPSYPIHQSPHWSSATFTDPDSPLPPPYRSLSPGFSYSPPENNPASSGITETVPPPRGTRRSTPPGSVREHTTASGRASGNPPTGISRCSSCKVTTSPEWRKGPSGKKDLCNACGLRFARSRAKKEGITTQRRRKDKVMALAKRESPSGASVPPIPVPYSNLRRGSYDDTFLSSSAGSTSGNETYSQQLHGPSNFDNITPSPSPPAGSISYSHYNPSSQSTRQTDSRGHYAVQQGSLYPSPLSHPHPPFQSQGQSHAPSSLPSLPLVLNRASPILSSTSSDSALSSAVPASFERERHRDSAVALPHVAMSEPRRVPTTTNKTTFVTR